jgi:hypothetical protein
LNIEEVTNTDEISDKKVSQETISDSKKAATRFIEDLISAGVLANDQKGDAIDLAEESLEDFDSDDSIEDLAKEITRDLIKEGEIGNNMKFKAQDTLIKSIALLQGVLTYEGEDVQYAPLTSGELSGYSRDIASALVNSRFLSGSEFENSITLISSILGDESLVNEDVSRLAILVTDKLQSSGKVNNRIRMRVLQVVERILVSRMQGRIAVETEVVELTEADSEEDVVAEKTEALVDEEKRQALVAASMLAATASGYQGAGLTSPIDIESMARLFAELEADTVMYAKAKSIEGIIPIITEAYKNHVAVDIRPIIGIIAKIEGDNNKKSDDVKLAQKLRGIVSAYYYPGTEKSCMVDEFSERIEKKTIRPLVGKIQQFLTQSLGTPIQRDSVFGFGTNAAISDYQAKNADTLDPYKLITSLERRDAGADVVSLQALYTKVLGVPLDTDGVYGKGVIENTLKFLTLGHDKSYAVEPNGIWNYPTYQRANEILGCQMGGNLAKNRMGIFGRLFSSITLGKVSFAK